MAKSKTAFVCNECGSDYAKWQGQCNDCGAWNTLSEVRLGGPTGGGAASRGGKARGGFAGSVSEARLLGDIDLAELFKQAGGVFRGGCYPLQFIEPLMVLWRRIGG